MTWVGLRDASGGTYSRAGLGCTTDDPVELDAMLARGTMMMEFELYPGLDGQVILSYFDDHPWISGLSLALDAKGTLVMTQRQGQHRRTYRLRTGLLGHASSVTLTYSWDAPRRCATLSAEVTQTGEISHVACPDPLPLPLRDAARLITDPARSKTADGLIFFAIADHIAPHGPKPTLSPDARVPTPDGFVQVADLRRGQLVIAADGQPAQVRWAGQIRLPSAGRYAPLRLRAPLHGATTDLICAHDQRMQLSGSEVEYLFATDFVAVHLGDLPESVSAPDPQLTRTYAQFVLDRPVPVEIGGLFLEGLDADPMLMDPVLRAASVLADVPTEILPQRAVAAAPVLRDFETKTLSFMCAA